MSNHKPNEFEKEAQVNNILSEFQTRPDPQINLSDIDRFLKTLVEICNQKHQKYTTQYIERRLMEKIEEDPLKRISHTNEANRLRSNIHHMLDINYFLTMMRHLGAIPFAELHKKLVESEPYKQYIKAVAHDESLDIGHHGKQHLPRINDVSGFIQQFLLPEIQVWNQDTVYLQNRFEMHVSNAIEHFKHNSKISPREPLIHQGKAKPIGDPNLSKRLQYQDEK